MATKIINRVNITIDEDLRFVLDAMKQVYPTLSYSDLIRMATGGYFASKKHEFIPSQSNPQTTKKMTQKEIDDWAATLPEMKLTPKQEQELEEAFEYNKKHPSKTYSNAKLMMKNILEEKI